MTLGETMGLARAVDVGSFAHASGLQLGIGGSESNVAVALTRLGVPTSWLSRLGDDSVGDLIRRELGAEGIAVHAVRDPDAPTGFMLKERRTAAHTKVWYYRAGSAGSRLRPADIDPGVIRGASLLHLTGITPALSASSRDAVHESIRIALDAEVPISFDLNYRAALWNADEAAAEYAAILPHVDVVFGGDEEFEILVGARDDPLVLARAVGEYGPREVVVKLGVDGCVALIDGVAYRRDAVPVDAIDTVGAGDAFVGGYLAEKLLGAEVAVRLHTAVTAGAFACLVPGDWEGMPRRSELGMLTAREPVVR